MSLTYGFCLDEPSSMYDSAQFSGALQSVTGDGVTASGSRLAATINGFSVTVGSGYALAAGRWLENDEPLVLAIQPSGNNDDRTDALVVRVDYTARKAALEVLANVDPSKLPGSLQGEGEYCIVLCLIRVPRGASTLTPEHVTDCRADPALCGTVVPLSSISGDVLYVYDFLRSGIDREVARIIGLSQALADRAAAEIARLDAAIQKAGGGPAVGELQTVRRGPTPGWLLCDGGPVPAEYSILSAMLSGILPNISRAEDRYRTYIYGGGHDV